jgi:hypothetical protein
VNDAIGALLIAGVGTAFGAVLSSIVESRSHRLADLFAGRAEMRKARRDNYYALLEAASAFIHYHEALSWHPGDWRTTDGEPSPQEKESLRLAGDMNAVLARIDLISLTSTAVAAQSYINKVLSIVEAGHDFVAESSPLKRERAEARGAFIVQARRDLNVMPIGFDADRLTWFEYQLTKVPFLRAKVMEKSAWVLDDEGQLLPSRDKHVDAPGSA